MLTFFKSVSHDQVNLKEIYSQGVEVQAQVTTKDIKK